MRLLEFDPVTFALQEVWTYYADLHAANAEGRVRWALAHRFTEYFGMTDLSPRSFEAMHHRLAQPQSALWAKYHGQSGGLYCTFYDGAKAPFASVYPCVGYPQGPLKEQWIAKLNATNLLA